MGYVHCESALDVLVDGLYEFQCKSVLRPNWVMFNHEFYLALQWWAISNGHMAKLFPDDPKKFETGEYRLCGMTMDYRANLKEPFKIMYVGEGYDFAD